MTSHKANATMAAPTSEAMQTRILNHMNTDHQNSLVLYSRYYSKLPLSHAKTSKLDSINLEHMIIESSFGRCLVPFNPPLESYSEARERVVAMHQECLRGLDVDEVVIDRYSLPSGSSTMHSRFLDDVDVCDISFPCAAQSGVRQCAELGMVDRWTVARASLDWPISPRPTC